MSEIEVVSAHEWDTWSSTNDAIILDVREPHEWELGTLPGATLIRMGEIVDRLAELDRAKPILVVCRSGGRSMQVATYLNSQGFRAANMGGGMKALGMQD